MAVGDGQWLSITPGGFFAAGRRGSELLAIVRGDQVTSVTQVYHVLYWPDLVQELLKGDPERKYKDAAFHLDLQKIMDFLVRRRSCSGSTGVLSAQEAR